jgi:hypothetical protein
MALTSQPAFALRLTTSLALSLRSVAIALRLIDVQPASTSGEGSVEVEESIQSTRSVGD